MKVEWREVPTNMYAHTRAFNDAGKLVGEVEEEPAYSGPGLFRATTYSPRPSWNFLGLFLTHAQAKAAIDRRLAPLAWDA